MGEEERQTWKQQVAQDWADRIRTGHGSKLTDNPEIAAMALAIHFGRKRWELALYIREQLDDTELDRLATEENPEDDPAGFY
jgi:uncharacterized phage protein gp47/JayE